jgi:hypothetical protein
MDPTSVWPLSTNNVTLVWPLASITSNNVTTVESAAVAAVVLSLAVVVEITNPQDPVLSLVNMVV